MFNYIKYHKTMALERLIKYTKFVEILVLSDPQPLKIFSPEGSS